MRWVVVVVVQEEERWFKQRGPCPRAMPRLVPYKSAVDPVIVHGFYCLLIGLGPRMETRRSGCSTSQNSPSCFVLPLCVDGVAQISCL